MQNTPDQIESNASDNEHFSDVIKVNQKRRQLLQGGFSLAAMAMLAGTAGCGHRMTRLGAAPVQGGLGPLAFRPIDGFISRARTQCEYGCVEESSMQSQIKRCWASCLSPTTERGHRKSPPAAFGRCIAGHDALPSVRTYRSLLSIVHET